MSARRASVPRRSCRETRCRARLVETRPLRACDLQGGHKVSLSVRHNGGGAGAQQALATQPVQIGVVRHFTHTRRRGESRIALGDRFGCRCAGLHAPGHRKRRFVRQRQIAAAYRIAIDGGIGKGRER